MSAAVHITWHEAQINFGDLPPYLTYELHENVMKKKTLQSSISNNGPNNYKDTKP